MNPHAASIRAQSRAHRQEAERLAYLALLAVEELRVTTEAKLANIAELREQAKREREEADDALRLADQIIADERRNRRRIA